MSGLGLLEPLHALLTRVATSNLTGQTVLIVGGSRGLGLELARELAASGCKLAVCARGNADLELARRELDRRGAAVFARACDATRPDQVNDLVHATLRRFGSLDMLITCPGSLHGERADRLRPSAVEEALTKIFWTAYHPTVAVLPHMQARKAGRIVHVGAAVCTGAEQSALDGRSEGRAGRVPAVIAISALTGFSASLRAELARDGVTITSIGAGEGAPSRLVHAPAQLEGSRAARRILRAAALRKSAVTLMPRMHGLFDTGSLGLGRFSQLRDPLGLRKDADVRQDGERTSLQSQIASPTTLLRAASRGSRY